MHARAQCPLPMMIRSVCTACSRVLDTFWLLLCIRVGQVGVLPPQVLQCSLDGVSLIGRHLNLCQPLSHLIKEQHRGGMVCVLKAIHLHAAAWPAMAARRAGVTHRKKIMRHTTRSRKLEALQGPRLGLLLEEAACVLGAPATMQQCT